MGDHNIFFLNLDLVKSCKILTKIEKSLIKRSLKNLQAID